MTILLRPKGPSDVSRLVEMVRQASMFLRTAPSSDSWLLVEIECQLEWNCSSLGVFFATYKEILPVQTYL